jgi:hypothetical protein
MSRFSFRYRSEVEAREWASAIEEKDERMLVQVYFDPRSSDWIVDVRSGHGLMKELGV